MRLTRLVRVFIAATAICSSQAWAVDFDLAIDTTKAIDSAVPGLTIEPRTTTNNTHTIVFQFDGAVTAAGTATVQTSVGGVLQNFGNVDSVVANGQEVIVTISGIPDRKRIKISLTGVNGSSTVYQAALGFLVGDIDGSGRVGVADLNAIRAISGAVPTQAAGNFLMDLDRSNRVSIADLNIVRAISGAALDAP